jgi:hypothetical protein
MVGQEYALGASICNFYTSHLPITGIDSYVRATTVDCAPIKAGALVEAAYTVGFPFNTINYWGL